MAKLRFLSPSRIVREWRRLRLGLCMVAAVLHAAAPARSFRIPSSDASIALQEFAAQSGEQIVFLVDNVRGETTRPLEGTFAPRQALEQLLAGTALSVSQDPTTGALVVGRKVSSPAPTLPKSDSATSPPAARRNHTTSGVDSDTVVKLSPFTVQDDRDHGYRATSTLAGTRLSSELKDLGASISVVTKTFMNDVNAVDLTSLLVYTLGTEVGGYGGNFSDLSNPEAQGVFDDALGQASPGTRIRGLSHADRTRNYFLTDIPLDSYNLERVEISRGANANLFGLGSPAGIINSSLIAANLGETATTASVSTGSYGTYRGALDHNHVLKPGALALRLAAVIDHTRYRIEFAHEKKRAATLAGAYQPFRDTKIRLTSELGRSDSNRPEVRPPFDRFSWWWAAGKPVWDPAAPGGGAGRLLGTPQPPFEANTVFTPTGQRQLSPSYFTANWGGSAPNEPMLFYLDPRSSALGGLPIGSGITVDGVKSFADNSALNAAGTALVPSGMLGLNSRVVVEQNTVQAANPLRSLFSREPMLSDPAVFDFFHQMLGGPTKFEWARWQAYNVTVEQTFFQQRAGLEIALDRQRIDNGFISPVSYAINLDPNERLPNGAPNPNFLRPVALGSGFKRVYSQDRDAWRATGYYRFDFRQTGPDWFSRLFGHHLFNGSYAQQHYLYQQLAGTLANNDLDWRVFENQPLPGTASSTARLVPIVHYLGPSALQVSTPAELRVEGLSAVHDPSGTPTMTLLTHQRPLSNVPSALTPWRPVTFNLLTNGRHDVQHTVRNAQRYSERLEQKARSFSAVLQSHWLKGNLVTTAGWRRDRVRNYDAGIPNQTPVGTADVRWESWSPQLTRTLAESSASFGAVAHLSPPLRRQLPAGIELSAFYNHATNFRVAPQRYTITGESLPSETGTTRELGVRVGLFDGRVDLRVGRFETWSDNATVNGFTSGLNQLAMIVAQVVDHNHLGSNTDNPEGIAAFENWLESPSGRTYRNAFNVQLAPNIDPAKPASQFGRYADATGDRGQINGVSSVKASGYELELTVNPTPRWRISANATRVDAVRTNIAPELYGFLFDRTSGLLALVQNTDGTPTAIGRLAGTPLGGTTAPLHSFVLGNVLNLGIASTFAQAGTRSDELRKWSFRAVTNYTFGDEIADGRLRGWGIGGAIRWSDAPLLGYAGTLANTGGALLPAADVSQPFYGNSEILTDGWISYSRRLRHGMRWKLQLNLRNLGVGNELKPLAVWPDGTVVQWTIREPQRWTLTSTLSF